MKKLVILACALGVLATLAIVPAFAQDAPQRIVRLSGWIVDEKTGADHANAESKAAVLAKATEGEALVFYTTEGETYPLVNQEKALAKVGQRWDVIGSVDSDGNLKVGTYIEPRPPKKAAPQAGAAKEKEKEKED
jgi:hypothetical protein